jgi:hypothetical protein
MMAVVAGDRPAAVEIAVELRAAAVATEIAAELCAGIATESSATAAAAVDRGAATPATSTAAACRRSAAAAAATAAAALCCGAGLRVAWRCRSGGNENHRRASRQQNLFHCTHLKIPPRTCVRISVHRDNAPVGQLFDHDFARDSRKPRMNAD